jgi:hypothetical protein
MHPGEPISALGLHEPPYGLNPIYAIKKLELNTCLLKKKVDRSIQDSPPIHDINILGEVNLLCCPKKPCVSVQRKKRNVQSRVEKLKSERSYA